LVARYRTAGGLFPAALFVRTRIVPNEEGSPCSSRLINTIRTGLIEIAATITLALPSLAAAYAVSYIRRAQAALEARTQAEIVDRMIARAAALAESTVWALESTVAKEVRRAVQEGVKSREELMAIGQRAVDDVLKHLGTEGQK